LVIELQRSPVVAIPPATHGENRETPPAGSGRFPARSTGIRADSRPAGRQSRSRKSVKAPARSRGFIYTQRPR
jgi:hypothetical protein